MYKKYYNYFEHNVKLHSELSPSSKAKGVFEMLTVEEALGAFRSSLKESKYVFRLLEPTWSLIGEDAQGMQEVEAGFIIAKKGSDRNKGKTHYIDSIASCEAIAHEFANKIMLDSNDGHPLFNYSVNTLKELKWHCQTMRKVGDGSFDGVIASFSFLMDFDTCIDTEKPFFTPTPADV